MIDKLKDVVTAVLIPGDGFRSRKFWFSVCTVATVEAIATYAFLFVTPARMTADQWTSMNVWLVPIAMAVYGGINLLDKKKKAA